MVQPLEEGGTGIYHKIRLELISGTPSECYFRNNSSFLSPYPLEGISSLVHAAQY